MPINTIKATIQMRRGLEQDFDADKMTAGEWAVSIDTKYVRMCFAPGIVLRMATYEAFEDDMLEIQTILASCEDIQDAVDAMAGAAEQHKNDAAFSAQAAHNSAEESDGFSKLSKSWAVGEGGIRPDEEINNSKYFAEQAARVVEAATSGALIPMGTIPFSNLPESGMSAGHMYNISTDFVTDSRFEDGSGIAYNSGSNVYRTANGKWDVLAGMQVTGVKGENDENYHTGNVNITKESLSIEKVGNFKSVSTEEQQLTGEEKITARRNIDALATDGDASDTSVSFEIAAQRAGLQSGDSLAVAFGKLAKFCADLKEHAFLDLIQNATTPDTNRSVSAAVVKNLQDQVTSLNTKLNSYLKNKTVNTGADGKLSVKLSGNIGKGAILVFGSYNNFPCIGAIQVSITSTGYWCFPKAIIRSFDSNENQVDYSPAVSITNDGVLTTILNSYGTYNLVSNFYIE